MNLNMYYDKIVYKLIHLVTVYEYNMYKIAKYITNGYNNDTEPVIAALIIMSTAFIVFNIFIFLDIFIKYGGKFSYFIKKHNKSTVLEYINSNNDETNNETNTTITSSTSTNESVTNYNKNETYDSTDDEYQSDDDFNLHIRIMNANSKNRKCKRYVTRKTMQTRSSKKQKYN